jgi:hypothetical protein
MARTPRRQPLTREAVVTAGLAIGDAERLDRMEP